MMSLVMPGMPNKIVFDAWLMLMRPGNAGGTVPELATVT